MKVLLTGTYISLFFVFWYFFLTLCRQRWLHPPANEQVPHPHLHQIGCPRYEIKFHLMLKFLKYPFIAIIAQSAGAVKYTKQSDGEAPLMLELWEMRSTPLLPSLPGPLWHGVVAPDRVLSMSPIELNCVLMLNWIVWNGTVYMDKMDLALDYNTTVDIR